MNFASYIKKKLTFEALLTSCYISKSVSKTFKYFTLREKFKTYNLKGILRVKVGNLEAEKIPANERSEDVCKHLGWPKDRDTNIKLIEAWRNYSNIY